MRMRTVLLAVTLAGGALAGCGSEDGTGEAITDVGQSSGTADSTDTTVDEADSSTTETTALQEVEIPGDPFDIGPGEGLRIDVIGVAHDDVLNFRALPDPSAEIGATAAPLAGSPVVLSRGEGRLLERGAWWAVAVDGQDLWANVAFLGLLGARGDVTTELVSQLGVAEAGSLDELTAAIAAVRGSGDPEPTITYVTDPDLGPGQQQVTIDLIGYGDDALLGERFVLTVTDQTTTMPSGVALMSAEATLLCYRGLVDGGCA